MSASRVSAGGSLENPGEHRFACRTWKRRYSNWSHAQAAIKRLKKYVRASGAPREKRVYACRECSGFHLSGKKTMKG